MGLSGRKAKQRIGKDPRNLSWADDAGRFGQAYLAKFGWDASKGLGASGEGRTNAVKAAQKLDMLGIGMRQQNDVEGGIAWRQNRDFEDLLRRLNEGTATATGDGTGPLESPPFHKVRESESGSESESLEGGVKDDGAEEEREDLMTKKEKEKKKKKKRKATIEGEEELEEGFDRKERKKKRKKTTSSKDGGNDDGRAMPSSIKSKPSPPRPPPADESESSPKATAIATAATVTAPVPIRAPPRTHRARIIAAKRMAASNSTALAEILGIPSSSSSSAYQSAVASPIPVIPDRAVALATTTTTTTTETQDSLQRLTTSSQSVSDYFKAKLSAKAHGERQARPTLAAVGATTAPAPAPAPAWARDDDEDDGRAGLGFGRVPPRVPTQDNLDEEPVRGGIGASSSSKFVTMFMPGQPTTKAREETTATAGAEPVADDDDNRRKSEKRRAKEERRREKEERRRKRAEAGQVTVVPVDGAPAAGEKKKHREPMTPDDWSADSHPSGAGGGEAIATKKRKKGVKDKKSAKHSRPKEE